MNTKIIEGSIPYSFEVPEELSIGEAEIYILRYRTGQFMLWELNELIRERLKISDWFGKSAMEEKENQNEKQS